MDMYKSFHDIVRLLCVFLEPLINISAWFITRVFILARSSILWFKSRITKQAPSHSNWRVESSALKCGQFLGEGFSGFVNEATWSRGRHTAGLLARKAFPAVPADVFEYEAYRLIALHHQNIVETYGWTIDRRSCSLVMDRMKYDLLSVVQKRMEAMRKGGRGATLPIPLREAVNIMYQIAAGVNYVHNNGLVHGDLIPNNVLVDSEAGLAMAVKIVDFGLTETKKWSTAALVSHHARCLQTLKWKAPELFEELLGSSFEDSDEVWTDMFPYKMSNAASSMNNDRAKKLQRADVYSFALTCSYILGAPPMSSKAGPFELRQEISSGAKRPLLPAECPGLLASLISRCWNKEPSRRPDFVDICKDLQHLKWDLRQNEEISQEYYRRSKSQGQGPSWTVIVSKGYKKASLNIYKTTLDKVHGAATGISKEGLYSSPRVRHFVHSTPNSDWIDMTTVSAESEESNADNRMAFEEFKARPEWGRFFFDFRDGELEMGELFAEGGQSRLFEGNWKKDDGKVLSVAIKAFKGKYKFSSEMLTFYTTEGHLRTSRVLRPLGATLLNSGEFALVMERYWGDLRKLIDLQMRSRIFLKDPPFKEEVAKHIMLQIAEGLAELHEFGIVHRDMKTVNVLVRDLKKFSVGRNQGFISCALIDYEGAENVLGTKFWMAPEVRAAFRWGKYSPVQHSSTRRADVYSYGMTCYEILTGKFPFDNLTSRAIKDVVLCGGRPDLPASVHPQLKDLVTRCWDPNPKKRPTSQEIVSRLKEMTTSHSKAS